MSRIACLESVWPPREATRKYDSESTFEMPLVSFAEVPRQGWSQQFSEALATFGLLLVILRTGDRASIVPLSVAGYIVAAYWFTSSTSFANPAVTIARAFSSSFAGIRVVDVLPFIGSQAVGASLALLTHRFLASKQRA